MWDGLKVNSNVDSKHIADVFVERKLKFLYSHYVVQTAAQVFLLSVPFRSHRDQLYCVCSVAELGQPVLFLSF